MKENIAQKIGSDYQPSRNLFFLASKRLLDIVLSVFALIIFSPVFLYVSIRILLEDGGPIFFKQERAGKNNEPFQIYKFRSMKSSNNKKPSSKIPYDWEDGVPDDFIFKSTKDFHPSVTRIGRVIRKYSLDELPQFFNVLKGEMSIVGPRPEITDITRCYNTFQTNRLLVKPGITGWAQVNGRSEIPHGEKIKFDLFYVNNQSLILDIKIIIQTAIQAVVAKDAI